MISGRGGVVDQMLSKNIEMLAVTLFQSIVYFCVELIGKSGGGCASVDLYPQSRRLLAVGQNMQMFQLKHARM